jgi:PKD repeat protein
MASTGTDGSHTYNKSGTYTVSLEVKDDEGATVSEKYTVTVHTKPKPPPTDNGSNSGLPIWGVGAAGAGIAVALIITVLFYLSKRKDQKSQPGRQKRAKNSGSKEEKK